MIRQRGGNQYHYQFKTGGKMYYGVCEGCTTKRAAEAYEKHIRDTLAGLAEQKTVRSLIENYRDELTGGSRILLRDAFSEYLKKPTKRSAGEHQTARNRTYWNDFVSFMEKRYPDIETLTNVTRKHADEYISMLRTTGAFSKAVSFDRAGRSMTYVPQNDKLSPRTINARHKAVKAVFSRLAADAGLIDNPFDIPTLDNATTGREAFTDDELRRIGEAMTMPYTRPVFTIGLCTGLTLGDICLLKWEEIEGDWITNKKRRKTGVKLEIPILPPLAAFLDEQRPQTGAGEYVCPELAEMYQCNSSGVCYRIREFLESLGIHTAEKVEGRSRAVSTKAAHAMRHTFAYLAGVYNIPQPIVQGVLGHMSPEMTALYQRHAQREQKEKFFQRMPNVLGVAATALPAAPAIGTTAAEPPGSGGIEADRAALRQLTDELPPVGGDSMGGRYYESKYKLSENRVKLLRKLAEKKLCSVYWENARAEGETALLQQSKIQYKPGYGIPLSEKERACFEELYEELTHMKLAASQKNAADILDFVWEKCGGNIAPLLEKMTPEEKCTLADSPLIFEMVKILWENATSATKNEAIAKMNEMLTNQNRMEAKQDQTMTAIIEGPTNPDAPRYMTCGKAAEELSSLLEGRNIKRQLQEYLHASETAESRAISTTERRGTKYYRIEDIAQAVEDITNNGNSNFRPLEYPEIFTEICKKGILKQDIRNRKEE